MVQTFKRKDPQVIEAIQFYRENWEEVKEFTNNMAHKLEVPLKNARAFMSIKQKGSKNKIVALEGQFIAKINDNFYPYEQDIFLNEFCEIQINNMEFK